jgi:general secretion pathway protein C
MKYLFQSYFWVIALFFIFSSSYLLANTTSQAIRLIIPYVPASPLSVKTRSLDLDEHRNLRASQTILNRSNLFDREQKPIVPPIPVAAPPPQDESKQPEFEQCDPKASYKKSELPLQLQGTAVASDANYSVAAVFDAQQRKLSVVRETDIYQGIRVCKIEPRYLKMDRGMGRFEYLELGDPPGKGGGASSYDRNLYQRYHQLRNTDLNLSSVKQKGNEQYELPRSLLTSVTERIDVLASQAAIVPYFRKGQPAGFRIYHIRNGSLYQKLGLTNGDVIQRINGYEFTSPERALEAYSNLMSAGNLSVEILRGGKTRTFSYDIKD